jgi:hypothetical protein
MRLDGCFAVEEIFVSGTGSRTNNPRSSSQHSSRYVAKTHTDTNTCLHLNHVVAIVFAESLLVSTPQIIQPRTKKLHVKRKAVYRLAAAQTH